MPGSITYETLWSIIRQQVDPVIRENWCRTVGFLIQDGRVTIDSRFLNTLDECSISELEQLLSGAPIEIVRLFINKLPLKSARRIVKTFRLADARLLEEAYRHPPQIAARAD